MVQLVDLKYSFLRYEILTKALESYLSCDYVDPYKFWSERRIENIYYYPFVVLSNSNIPAGVIELYVRSESHGLAELKLAFWNNAWSDVLFKSIVIFFDYVFNDKEMNNVFYWCVEGKAIDRISRKLFLHASGIANYNNTTFYAYNIGKDDWLSGNLKINLNKRTR